ncbi:MAG: MlaD family protein [Desulfovibrionaceae bacterium]|nr:MlaD family protein [Desulfovibrionaceae bacterium]
MEIRANYVLIGAFTLLTLLAAGLFILWIGGKGKNTAMIEYEISSTESVRGLSINSDVLFSGIRVGKVTDITISRITPGAVHIHISIAADTPVREDSVAQLEARGITGISVISISGGSAQSPLIQVPKGGVGVILYAPSPLSSVVTQVPDVLASSGQVLRRMEQMFSEENVLAVNEILTSLARISNTLADRSESLNTILLEVEKSSGRLNTLLATANEALAVDMKQTSAAVTGMAKRADSTLAAMEPGLRQFSTQGLADMRMLVTEMRNLVHVFTRVGQKLENDPRRFLFGDSVQEYQNR